MKGWERENTFKVISEPKETSPDTVKCSNSTKLGIDFIRRVYSATYSQLIIK